MPGSQRDSAYRGALTALVRHLTGFARELKEYNTAVEQDPGSATPPVQKRLEPSSVAEVDAVSASLSAAVQVLSRHSTFDQG